MKKRKLLSLGIATLMVISSTFTAFADVTTSPAEGSIEGSGTLEGFVDKDVFVVTVPTTPNVNFKIDPQELLLATKGTSNLKLDGNDITAGYGDDILFIGDDNGNYLSQSKNISIVNKSTFAVDITVNASLSGLTKAADSDGNGAYDIKVLDKDTAFGQDTAIKMKLSAILTDGDGEEIVLTDGDGNEIDTTVYLDDSTNGVDNSITLAPITDLSTAYEYKKDSNGDYSYGLKADLSSAKFNTATFNLSGSVNADADWTNFSKDDNANLEVEITYSISKASDASGEGSYETAYQVFTGSSGNTIIGINNNADNGGITSQASVTNVQKNGSTVAYTYSTARYAISIASANWANGDVITFTVGDVNYKVTLSR